MEKIQTLYEEGPEELRELLNAKAKNADGFNYSSIRNVNERLESAIKLPFYMLAEGLFKVMPETDNPILDTIKNTGIKYFQLRKHDAGKTLFENPCGGIPGIGPYLSKFIQNLWPVLHFGELTTIQTMYTVRDTNTGVELPFYLQGKGEGIPPLHDMFQIAQRVLSGGVSASRSAIMSSLSRYANPEAELAGVYEELTDGDLEKLKIVGRREILNVYLPEEVWFIGREGRRQVVARDPRSGLEIVKYNRPSKLEFMAFYGLNDLGYTLVDLPIQPLEAKYADGLRETGLYISLMNIVKKGVRGLYGEIRSDGIRNPVSYILQT